MFSDILKGGRKITPAVAMRLAKVFGLGSSEVRYFELLVLYDQSESEEERRTHLERLVRVGPFRVGGPWDLRILMLCRSHRNRDDTWTEVWGGILQKPALDPGAWAQACLAEPSSSP